MSKASDFPLVSIITPTYNHEKYIAECIESVISQTYTKWEMIIIDDGSSDNTFKIAENYSAKDKRIKAFRQENIGIFRLAETYNKALDISTGSLIAILEGDDIWERTKLEEQVKVLMEKPQVILCFSQATCTNTEQTVIYSVSPDSNNSEVKYYFNSPDSSAMNVLLFKNFIPALTMIIRKEALLQVNGFKQSYNLPLVDIPTLYQLAQVGEFYFIPKSLGYWRTYSTQITKVFPHKISEGFFKLALDFYEQNRTKNIVNLEIRKKDLIKHYHKLLISSYSRSGRYKLARKEFKSARKDYIKSITSFGFNEPVWKLRSLVGFVFSFFHLNVEWLARLFGKKIYNLE